MPNSSPQARSLRFGPFELDLRSGELLKEGVRIKLQEQPLQVLAILLENPGEVVTRDDLRRRLWPAHTFVDFEHGLNKAINKIREALEDSAEYPRYVETLPRRGYRFLEVASQNRCDVIDSIAVLPFINTSADPDAECLALGIPGSIIHNLSQIPQLRVIAWNAASVVKGRGSSSETGAQQLHARAILLGRIWQRGSRLRLQVDLVDSTTDEELWGEQYDRDITEVFSLQDEISSEVSHKLRLKLTGDQASRLVRRHTQNVEAYQLYVRGRRNSEKRSTEGFKKGVEYLTEAIRKDPNYALAYAELAQCIYVPAYYGLVSPHQAYPKAKELALKALEMDDTLAEAHDALATVMQNYNYDWLGAGTEYKRAIKLNPNYPIARFHYSMHLAFLRRFDESIREANEGQVRDPMSGVINAGVAFSLACARHFDSCIEQSITAIDVDPQMTFSYVSLGTAYEAIGMFVEALATHEKGLAFGGSPALHMSMAGHAHAASGNHARARELLTELEGLSSREYVPFWSLAIIHEGLGETEFAIKCLEKALVNRESLLVTIGVWPHFDKLRHDSRFQEIERRVGLR
jgi:TolB-like protein